MALRHSCPMVFLWGLSDEVLSGQDLINLWNLCVCLSDIQGIHLKLRSPLRVPEVRTTSTKKNKSCNIKTFVNEVVMVQSIPSGRKVSGVFWPPESS